MASDEHRDNATPASRVRITWTQGGTAQVEVLEGERIELVSTRPFAPGARPEGTFEIAGRVRPIRLKCHGSRRLDDGTFRVMGRLLNVTREVRELLKEAVSMEPNGGKDLGP